MNLAANAQIAGCGLKVTDTDKRANLNGAANSQKALRNTRETNQ